MLEAELQGFPEIFAAIVEIGGIFQCSKLALVGRVVTFGTVLHLVRFGQNGGR